MNLIYLANNLLLLAGGSLDGDALMNNDQRVGVALAGLGIVIGALAILVIAIFLFGKLFDFLHSDKKKAQTATVSAKAPKPEPAKPVAAKPVSPSVAAPVAPVQDDDEVIAVISAVVAMMSEADGTVYKVKSVKPAGNAFSGRSAWAMDGRRQNVAPF